MKVSTTHFLYFLKQYLILKSWTSHLIDHTSGAGALIFNVYNIQKQSVFISNLLSPTHFAKTCITYIRFILIIFCLIPCLASGHIKHMLWIIRIYNARPQYFKSKCISFNLYQHLIHQVTYALNSCKNPHGMNNVKSCQHTNVGLRVCSLFKCNKGVSPDLMRWKLQPQILDVMVEAGASPECFLWGGGGRGLTLRLHIIYILF
jgi:hypothetical protein